MSETLLRQEKGIVVVLLAVGLLAVLLAVAGLSLDLGHYFIVKGQLQTAADGIALAGAGKASAALAGAGNADPSNSLLTASSEAAAFIGKNSADGVRLDSADIRYGWWNLATARWKPGSPVTSGTPPGVPESLCTVSRAPCTGNSDCPNDSCSRQEVPGFRVMVSKSEGSNGGPVPTPFARVVGFEGFSPSSRATVALSGAPASVGINTVFPWAISKSTADPYSARLASAPRDPNDTAPILLSNGGTAPSELGQWTSFTDRNNGVPGTGTVSVLPPVTGSNPTPLAVGTLIHIAPGARSNLFNDIPIGPSGIDVILPIVSSLTPSTDQPLLGFIGFHIIETFPPGSPDSLRGYFTAIEASGGSHVGGPNYGVYSHPYLVSVPQGQ
jgi:Flp pilus assembly protein TadG